MSILLKKQYKNKRNKSFLILGFVFLAVLSLSFLQNNTRSVQAIDTSNYNTGSFTPVTQYSSLVQSGTLAHPYIINLTKNFDYVTQLVWTLEFPTTSINFEDFAADLPLTNGLNVLYNSQSLIDNNNITANHMLFHFASQVNIFSDANSPHDNILVSTWAVDYYIPNGFLITPNKGLQIFIQDDLTALTTVTSFTIYIKGYEIQTQQTSVQKVNNQPTGFMGIFMTMIDLLNQFWYMFIGATFVLLLIYKKVYG